MKITKDSIKKKKVDFDFLNQPLEFKPIPTIEHFQMQKMFEKKKDEEDKDYASRLAKNMATIIIRYASLDNTAKELMEVLSLDNLSEIIRTMAGTEEEGNFTKSQNTGSPTTDSE